ncbi:Hint domain-containing protein [Litoreibacter ponti]|nr:Hint domain-containing protein [Litoreibacter ponti]
MNQSFGGGNEIKAKQSGLLGGVRVLTMNGYQPIEALQAGDRVVTRNGMRVLADIYVEEHLMRPIRVGQGTLGFNRPDTDMMMAPDQEVMVRDWRAEMLFGRDMVIVNINTMVDGKYIVEAETEQLHKVYQLQFEQEEIFYADGVEIVSDYATAVAAEAQQLLQAA